MKMQNPFTGELVHVQQAVFKDQVWEDVRKNFAAYFQAEGDKKRQWYAYLHGIATRLNFSEDSWKFFGGEMRRLFAVEGNFLIFDEEEDATRFLNLAAEFHRGLSGS